MTATDGTPAIRLQQVPESLDALVGPYFEHLPPDPLTRGPFVYYPRGLPYDLTEPRPGNDPIVLLAEGTPFLWTSRGAPNVMTRRGGTSEDRMDEAATLTRGTRFPPRCPAD